MNTAKNELKKKLNLILMNGQLASKWTPRKGDIANEIRIFFGMTPKQYRKSLVSLTKVVETQMCAKEWDKINFSGVPSVAHSRYKKAFNRNTSMYAEYVKSLVSGEKGVKINASSIFPYEVLKDIKNAQDRTVLDVIVKQWEALPNYLGDASVLALVDVSGSMSVPAGNNTSVTCLDVAVSLGLYTADKNKGKFKDTFLTFSTTPELLYLKGNIYEKYGQMMRSSWNMSTDLNAAFDKILETAINGKVPQEEMPSTLLILSDMQFNACVEYDDSAMQMIQRKYEAHGYKVPGVVFWNLNAHHNVPVSFNEKGVCLVSGFSPAIMQSILSGNSEEFRPENIMKKTIMNERYDW